MRDPSCAETTIASFMRRTAWPPARPAAAPGDFVARVTAAVNRDRWRAERSFDLWFNVLIGLVVLVVVAGLATLLNLSGLSAVAGDVSDLMITGFVLVAGRIGVALPVYAAASALLIVGGGLWWWTERRPV